MPPSTIAVVTGANKGIGLAIVRQLALQYPSSHVASAANSQTKPLTIYLTSRSTPRGTEALTTLQSDPQLTKVNALSSSGGLTSIKHAELDITQTKSIQELRDQLKADHPDGIDILINNAGIALDGFDSEKAKKTIECNYYGTLETCQDLMPLVKKGGRVVNVASMAGSLSKYSEELKKRFREAKEVGEVTALMEEFKQSVGDGDWQEKGWPGSMYGVSKAGVIALTRVLAKEEEKEGKERVINSVCPGYVDTDMSKHRGHKTIDEGAKTPVHLALGDLGGKTGEFWMDGEVASWDADIMGRLLKGRRKPRIKAR